MVVEAGSHWHKGYRNPSPPERLFYKSYLPGSASPGTHIDVHPGQRAVGFYWYGVPMLTLLALEEALLCSQRVPWDSRDLTSDHWQEDGGHV